MPTIANTIDRVVHWTEEHICQKILLKVPPADNKDPDGSGFEYEMVHPACFPLFVPGSDKIPGNIKAPVPSICIRLLDGEDMRTTGNINIEMWFSIWNPGTHGQDILEDVDGSTHALREWNTDEAMLFFERNSNGWRDLWNSIDIALREIETIGHIDGMRIDLENGVRYGPLKEDGGIPDYYPFWFGFISFTLERPIVRNPEYIEFL